MNNNKLKVLYLVFLFGFIASCNTTENELSDENVIVPGKKVAILEKGEFEIFDGFNLRTDWEKTLKKQGFDVKLDKFELVKGDLTNNGEETLILRSESIDKTITTGIVVEKIGDNYYQVASAGTVTCKGCRRGCNPKTDSHGDWYCTDCQIQNSSCTKTVVVSTGDQ